jgi:TorA maturation chaperone TorD
MSTETVQVDFRPSLAPEDQGRADIYALLARLWYAAPDAALLEAIAAADEIVAEGEQATLEESWRQLQAVAAVAEPELVAAEYEDLFGGTGKARITLYSGHYLADVAKERVLVALREDLAGFGLARLKRASEPEDHLAALFDVMRHLIAAGASDAALQRQRKFFTRYIAPAYNRFTEQVFIAEGGRLFYQFVARFTKAFLDIESAGLEML